MSASTDWVAWMHDPMWVVLGVLGYDAGRNFIGECVTVMLLALREHGTISLETLGRVLQVDSDDNDTLTVEAW